MQKAIDDPRWARWGPRNNPQMEENDVCAPDFKGVPRTAEEVHAMSLANPQDEYASIVTTADILSALENS